MKGRLLKALILRKMAFTIRTELEDVWKFAAEDLLLPFAR